MSEVTASSETGESTQRWSAVTGPDDLLIIAHLFDSVNGTSFDTTARVMTNRVHQSVTDSSLASAVLGSHAGDMGTALAATESLVYEHHGLPWRPKPGCTSTFEEFVHSRAHVVEIWNETDWNPWRKEELEPQVERALAVDDEWECADPDWKPLTKRQTGARMAAITRKVKAESKQREERWERDAARYDSERERARYALLELEAIQRSQAEEARDLGSGALYPGMPQDRRAVRLVELEAELQKTAAEVGRLADVVGDREDVVDKYGRLPRDRRTWQLCDYRYQRIKKVEGLREAIATQKGKIAEIKDRSEKSRLRVHLSLDERRLAVLLAVPRLEAEQMCADCPTPQYQHAYGDVTEYSLCPHWPRHRARIERAWEILRSASERNTPATPPPPKLEPLATLPGNLGIGEVIERLKELQEKHPDAVVKRGRSNKWELWPGPDGSVEAPDQ